MSSGMVKMVGRKECIKLKAGFIIIIITRFCNACFFVFVCLFDVVVVLVCVCAFFFSF